MILFSYSRAKQSVNLVLFKSLSVAFKVFIYKLSDLLP